MYWHRQLQLVLQFLATPLPMDEVQQQTCKIDGRIYFQKLFLKTQVLSM